ncbi:hypothetical protein C2845_PM01G38890 [Panicum miliaceum]|uniref:Uncharacterized protein n=1 Tax=Panicum miliaceum TaxID=4540 RepID=A0A3L6THH2_PANMI|nr:hypothetical protein C2845_PM01G38890 [Panicum miliaceum]
MANAKTAVAIAVLALFQVSCAAARRHGKPGPLGRSVVARVADECDSRRGIVGSSLALWRALGLDTGVGEAPVTWSDA